MAKKKKEDIENEDDINKESQDDFNEADDSFGLPDVDYEPIDRDENQEEEGTLSDDVYASASGISDYSEESADDYSTDRSDDYNDESSEVDYSNDYDSTDEQEESQEEEYVPGSYTPPENDNSIVGKVIAIILVLILAGGAVWYFGFYRPEQQKIEQAKIEKQKKAEEEKAAKAAAEQKRQEELAAQRAAEAAAAREAEAQPKEASINAITSRTGRYYVVVSSAIDDDLARDFAEKKKQEGVSTSILSPVGTSKFHRVAVGDFDTWADAQAKADELKGEYGEGVWVIKY